MNDLLQWLHGNEQYASFCLTNHGYIVGAVFWRDLTTDAEGTLQSRPWHIRIWNKGQFEELPGAFLTKEDAMLCLELLYTDGYKFPNPTC